MIIYTHAQTSLEFLRSAFARLTVGSKVSNAALEKYRRKQGTIAAGGAPETLDVYKSIYRNKKLTPEEQYRALFGKPFEQE
ncbi:hypothetical protein ACL58G_12025 [Massilia sp. GER05]|uniref:hypothetical protein n=1 Tax=unclassified Massilia TaxID=2609279 RepID=UPI0039A6F1F8